MTAPPQPCIRGCVFPGRLLDDGTQGEAEPRPAKQGFLCDRCAEKLFGWLDSFVDLYTMLPIEPAAMAGDHRTHKVSHSPALARLDVVALCDPRTRPGDPDAQFVEDGPEKGKTIVPPKLQPVYIPNEVGGWALMFAEEQGLASPVTTLVEAVAMLKAWFQTLVAQPWVDEFYTDMADVARLLNAAHGVERPRLVGTCISIVGSTADPHMCGRDLYARDGEEVRCPGCKRRYSGLDLLRAANTREQAERRAG